MAFTMKVSESEKIIDRWIDQAAEIIETMTGTRPDNDSLLYELADCEWIICGGFSEDEEELIDMEAALRQLSYIVERTIENIRAEQED